MIATIMIAIRDITTGTIMIATAIITIMTASMIMTAKPRTIGMNTIIATFGIARDVIGTGSGNRKFAKDSFSRPICARLFVQCPAACIES